MKFVGNHSSIKNTCAWNDDGKIVFVLWITKESRPVCLGENWKMMVKVRMKVTSAFPLVNPTASFSLWCILKDPYLNNLQNLTLHFKRLYCKDYIMRIWHSITNWMEGSREKSTVCYREWVLTCSFCYWFEVVAHPCYIIFGLFM